MNQRTLFLGRAIGLLAVLVTASAAFADNPDARLRKQIEQLSEKSRSKNVRPSRFEVEKPRDPLAEIKSSISNEEKGALRNDKDEVENAQPFVDEWQQVNLLRGHYRLTSGVGFPSSAEIVVPPVPTFSTPSISDEPAVWHSEEQPLSRPPRCEKNGTNRVLRYPEADDTKILHEQIYLSEDLVPLDAAEVYGSQVRLISYGEPASLEVMQRMRSEQIPCVPFRRRLTAAAIYEDWGINALKKYEAKPAAPGVFHPWIEQKLFKGK
jgi:hypothetical protein